MKPLSKGDICRVRLHTGEVVEAVYDGPDRHNKKFHWVDLGDCLLALAWDIEPIAGNEFSFPFVRFVGPPCVLVPMGGE